MGTCELCFSGRHVRCHDTKCGCSVCNRSVAKPHRMPTKRTRPSSSTVKRPYVSTKPRPYVKRNTTRTKNLSKYGFYSSLPDEQVQQIIEWRDEKVSISESARRLGVSRDMVRNVYKGGSKNTWSPPEKDRSSEVIPAKVIAAASEMFGVSVEDITGRSLTHSLVDIRHIAMYVSRHLHEENPPSYPRIAREFSRDHTSVINGIHRVAREEVLLERATELLESLR